MKKINVLVVPSDLQGGVGFYRSIQPHKQLEKQFPEEFGVTIEPNPDFNNLEYFKNFDIIHIHKGIFGNMPLFYSAMNFFKENHIVTVMDIDDYWELNSHHPLYLANQKNGTTKLILENLRLFDYVTTTTPLFADEIRKFNPNVFVIPNAIDPTDPNFAVNKTDSKFVRVGMIMGSSHEYDMALLNNVACSLPTEIIDKIQFVLCGYDLRGSRKEYTLKQEFLDKIKKYPPKKRRQIKPTENDYTIVERPVEPLEGVWYRYEKMLTNNFHIISEEYKEFLHKFLWGVQYPDVENEHYKRCWTKDMNHYYEHFSECDILLAPIEATKFNRVKSQLKVIESAFSHTAIIASDYGPYTIDLKTAMEKGGVWNENGNALLVDEGRNHKDWAKYIAHLVQNPEHLKQLQDNLQRDICEKYDLRNVTKERADIYKKICS